MTDQAQAAEAAPARMRGYDFARALAIVGMVLINFPIFLASVSDTAGTVLAWASHIHGGRAAALFVTVAGAGIALMARGAGVWDVRRTLLLRALFLFVAGNLLILVWWIDILHFYAFYLAIAALLLITLPRWALLAGAIAVALAAPAIAWLWPEFNIGNDTDIGWADGALQLGDYWSAPGMAANVFVTGIHPVLPWLAFIMVGLWIGRHDLADKATRGWLMAMGATLAVSAPLLSTALEHAVLAGAAPDSALALLGVSHAPSPLYVMGACGTSMFVIALSQAIVARWDAALPVRALVHAGQMAFTIYIAHALVGALLPQAFGFTSEHLAWVIAYSFAFCAIVVVLAHFYRLRFKRGPVEMLMRRIAGESPAKRERPELARIAAPARWWLPAAGAAAAIVVALQIVGAPPRLACADKPELGARSVSALTLLCRTQGFTFAVNERADVTLETHSARDLYLELYRDGEMIAQNDDGGEGANARLTATLEPGAYAIRIRPYQSAVGPFALTRAAAAPTRRELAPGEICTDSCASARDNECDDGGPDSLYAVCELGSDCADCGVRTAADEQSMLDANGMLCANTCGYANDGECDDGGANSLYAICAYGSDCGDCGPRQPRHAAAP